jgi:hypothetical protein
MDKMSRLEVLRLMERYIGSSGGCLGTFGSHSELLRFYIDCDVDVNPLDYQGTNKTRFQSILETSPPEVRAKIMRGILKRYPPESSSVTRTQALHDEFLALAQRLEGAAVVENPTPAITSAIVERTLADAETLIKQSGATSGVDRIHTGLHGYMRAVCNKAGVSYTQEATIVGLFKAIQANHPAFKKPGPRSQDIAQIMRSMTVIMDVLNPIRNNASPAHPNEDLLEAPEAMLVINATRTILHYVDAKLAGTSFR